VGEAVQSSPELLALHAVRLKGMADDDQVAERFGLDPAAARENLLDFQAVGWVTKVDFAGAGGWTLTGSGSAENERQLAQELAVTDSAGPLTMPIASSCPTTIGSCAPPPTGSFGPARQTRSPPTTTPTRTGTGEWSTSCRL